MGFTPKTFEQLVTRAIEWIKGSTSKLTDFSIGSRTRSIIEAVARLLEEFYVSAYSMLKSVIEESIYLVFDFPLLPAKKATGIVTLARSTASPANYTIPMGTIVGTEKNDLSAEIYFETTASATLAIGQTSVDIAIRALKEGSQGNVAAGKITKFLAKPAGVETLTNILAVVDGRNLETRDERKLRFRDYIASRSKGTLQSLEYGASTVDGVTFAKSYESPKILAFIWDNSGFIDVTTAANDPYEIPTNVFPATETVGNALYLGAIGKFNFLYFHFATPGTGSGGVWEYYDGAAWQTLTATDGTNQMTQTGVLKFTAPTDWKDTKINNAWAFWIRFRITSASYTVTPQVGHLFASPPPGIVELYVQDENGDAADDLLASVVTAVESYRGAGVQVNVRRPTKLLLAPVCNIKVATTVSDKTAAQTRVVQLITDHLNEFTIGQNFVLSKLSSKILMMDGGELIEAVTFTTPTSDILVSPAEIIRPDTANLQVVVVN